MTVVLIVFVLLLFHSCWFYSDITITATKLITCDSSDPNSLYLTNNWETAVVCVVVSKCWSKQPDFFTKLNRVKKKQQKKTTCQRPQLELFIDFHGSCFSLITHRATVKPERGTSEETLLPTWNCQKYQNPKPNWEPISFNYKGFLFGVASLLRMPAMAGGLPTDAHSQYAIVPFLHRVVGWETRQRDKMPTESVEDHCQVKCSTHTHRRSVSQSVSFFVSGRFSTIMVLACKSEMVDGVWGILKNI